MKTIGLIGGMSWESTEIYYRAINEEVRARLGGLHSAKIILYSVDFHDMERLQETGEWEAAGRILGQAAKALEAAGAHFIVLCTNTMHRVSGDIQRQIEIPFLHIADATAQEINPSAYPGLKPGVCSGLILSGASDPVLKDGVWRRRSIKKAGKTKVGLLGTRFTMEQDFYKSRLTDHGLQVLIPDEFDRKVVHEVIYGELCLGLVREQSRKEFKTIIGKLENHGVQGVILGCTEISLLLRPHDSPVPLFDTTAIHARHAVEWALSGDEGR